MHNFELTLEYQNDYIKAHDTLYKITQAEEIAELQTIYETERKDHENKILRQESQIKDLDLHIHVWNNNVHTQF